jgi:DNA replication protein DnaD
MKSPNKLSIVTFTAFNMLSTKVFEDVEMNDIESLIQKETTETAILHSVVEYDVVAKRKKNFHPMMKINTDNSDKHLKLAGEIQQRSDEENNVKDIDEKSPK